MGLPMPSSRTTSKVGVESKDSIVAKKLEMTVVEFLFACKEHKWFFTLSWVEKRLKQLELDREQEASKA